MESCPPQEVVAAGEVTGGEEAAEAQEVSRGEEGVADVVSLSAQAQLTLIGDPAESLSLAMSWRRRKRWSNTSSSLARSLTRWKMR